MPRSGIWIVGSSPDSETSVAGRLPWPCSDWHFCRLLARDQELHLLLNFRNRDGGDIGLTQLPVKLR
jgi:hypothetical protein